MTIDEATRSITIFAAVEDESQILRTLRACQNSSPGVATLVDVLVNGNRQLADSLLETLSSHLLPVRHSLRLWFSAIPDKAHTWNLYFEHVWPNSDVAFFVDGYVEPRANTLRLLSEALDSHPEAYASSAVPTVGSSASKQREFQLRINGINGNLFALTKEAVEQLRMSGFHLPRGIYRTDGTMQAFLKYSFKPRECEFNRDRVAVVPEASYDRSTLSIFRWSDVQKQWRRINRQRQGKLITAALKQLLSDAAPNGRTNPRDIPETVRELVGDWIKGSPADWKKMALRNPLLVLAAKKAAAFQDWEGTSDPPELLLSLGKPIK